MNGLVVIDKPAGLTSHDVVNRWRRIAGTRRAGHLGTLDPMATGVLLIVSGVATRLAPFFSADQKVYEAEITFGVVSDTYDAAGEVSETGAAIPGQFEIEQALGQFRGPLLQTPPPVSAKKIQGVPAYKLARKKIPVDLPAVPVEIFELQMLFCAGDRVGVRIRCTSGTYMRGIAHDLGRALSCGAVLSALRRTSVGRFDIDAAYTLQGLAALAESGKLGEAMISPARMLPAIPKQHVDELVEQQIRNGREFRTSPFTVLPGSPLVQAISRSGELVSIGELRYPNVYHPKIVL